MALMSFLYDVAYIIGIIIGLYLLQKAIRAWARGRFSYHTSLRHVIRTLQRLRKNRSMKELATLEIHIVSRNPVFDTSPWWELFVNGVQHLQNLNLVFIVQGPVSPTMTDGANVPLLSDDKIINFQVKHMLYHMFFSSEDYNEPDAILIYDNMMLVNGADDIHNEISYRNMTSSKKTVLVLLDTKEELLKQGVKAVNAVRPMDQPKLPGQPMVTLVSRYYFTCLKRK